MAAPNMRRRVDAAVRAADHLTPEHAATIQVARALADAIDDAYRDDNGGATYRKYLGWISPNLTHALKALGLTVDPATPKAKSLPTGRLAQLRAERDRQWPA